MQLRYVFSGRHVDRNANTLFVFSYKRLCPDRIPEALVRSPKTATTCH